MIASVVTGRGNNRAVIHRERNYKFSQALTVAICTYLGIAMPERGKAALRGSKSRKGRARRNKGSQH